jgi:hypothetical protein
MVAGSPTKCQSNKRRKYKTSNDKTSKDKTPNGTKRRMGQNVEWKKRRLVEKLLNGKNVEKHL